MSEPVASTVIGFKDWGLDRLERCILSIRASFDPVPCEVIVSDYGSADPDSVSAVAAGAGARYVRTETDGTWSRSRALNAGFAQARGRQFYATDADMIFTPGALAAVSDRLSRQPGEAIILQCRDLPPEVGTEAAGEVDWDRCARLATVRPRWGMGGLVATDRAVFGRLRGYDERMHTYGGEDIDYAKRLRRHGVPINWLDRQGVRMYHVWHPSSRLAALRDEAATAAVAHNRRIHTEDRTMARNRVATTHLGGVLPPLVTVVVAVDGHPEACAAEVGNLLGQSVSELEVLLVGAGEAHAVADSVQDGRVRVVPAVEGAWWRALTQARGTYATLHAPGTWHPPHRLERLLDHTGDRHVIPADMPVVAVPSEMDTLVAVPPTGEALHRQPWSSLLLPTDTARTLVQTLPDSVQDPQDLVLALVRMGLTIHQTDEVRVQVLPDDSSTERLLHRVDEDSARLTRLLRAADLPVGWVTQGVDPTIVEHALAAAERLTRDRLDLRIWSSEPDLLDAAVGLLDEQASRRRASLRDSRGEEVFGILTLSGVPGATMRRVRRRAEDSVAGGRTRIEALHDDGQELLGDAVPAVIDECTRLYADEPASASWVVVRSGEAAHAEPAARLLERRPDVNIVLLRVLLEEHEPEVHLSLALFSSAVSAFEAMVAVRGESPEHRSVELRLGPAHQHTLSDLAGGPA